MASNVTPLRADVSLSAAKQMLLDTIAEQFDICAASTGEPLGVVFALVDADGGGATGYHIIGQEGRDALYVARAAHMLSTDSALWLQPNG